MRTTLSICSFLLLAIVTAAGNEADTPDSDNRSGPAASGGTCKEDLPAGPNSATPAGAAFSWPKGARGALSISFDDARGSQVDHHSSALFKKHGIRVTYFVSLANVEKKLDLWRAVVADGHEIGNHSLQHPCSGNFPWIGDGESALENYSLPKIEAELLEANRRIGEMLGVTPVSYAYPCGLDFVGRGERRASYVPVVARHFLVGRGYRGEYANNPIFCDLSMVQGFGADHDDLSALKAYADQAINSGYWIILIAHEVPEHPGGDGMSTGNIAALCSYLQSKPELWVETIGTVGAYVQSHRNLDATSTVEQEKR